MIFNLKYNKHQKNVFKLYLFQTKYFNRQTIELFGRIKYKYYINKWILQLLGII